MLVRGSIPTEPIPASNRHKVKFVRHSPQAIGYHLHIHNAAGCFNCLVQRASQKNPQITQIKLHLRNLWMAYA